MTFDHHQRYVILILCIDALSDGSQDAFELYYSETYSESSSLSPQDSHRSLASASEGGDSNPALVLMQEYMITVSVCVRVCVTYRRSVMNER